MAKVKDLTGQHFGQLTVLYRVENTKAGRTVWHCKCSCGNECDVQSNNLISGNTTSCGCKQKQQAVAKIRGKKFGKLTPLYPTDKRTGNRSIIWHCKCDCGNECDVAAYSLVNGHTSSCGCLNKEQIRKIGYHNKKDLTNQRFGKLTVMYDTKIRRQGNIVWHCKCDCGNEIDVREKCLIGGETQSCGCLTSSHGILKIQELLIDNKISYITEKTFNNCRFSETNALARYDFYLPEYNILIEFDGIQHFSPNHFYGGEEEFEKRKSYDKYKNQYALEHGYTLIRIPYFDEDKINIDMLLGKDTNYIVTSIN